MPTQLDCGVDRLLVDTPRDGIVLVTLNRPEARNAVSFEMWQGFSALLDQLERDTPARALVLTGAGPLFSTGGDMKIPPARGEGALSPAARLEWGQRTIARLRRLPIPVIAAVEGGAWGIGWSLALACDLVFAADDARFGAPFVRFGLAPDGGSCWLLARQLGRHRAAELLLSGRDIDATEALSLGLVSRVCAAGNVLDAALDFADRLGDGNRHAVELTRRLLHAADDGGSLEASHALELAYCSILQKGDELERARAAFAARSAAKRKT
ncbi:enoyl-CoA hydratase/isomerase family protein [Luteimonas saliphila]|uniref:enoyl-CoA hydratase/isomerase family protein n=1 Tax=Luteimonas saliphila TaxID=2804919 RepID=UPI00192E2952|nr:enoyl-CoA hydratase/isomerase family protein [Luteimonas saliphila]